MPNASTRKPLRDHSSTIPRISSRFTGTLEPSAASIAVERSRTASAAPFVKDTYEPLRS